MSPPHALFLPATSARGTTAKAISAFHADARKPSLLRDSVPGVRQEAPQSSALRLCRPPLGYAPSTPLIAPFQGWGTPPLALAAPAGVGQGQGVFVGKHSTAIQNGVTTPDLHRDILPGRQQTQAIQLQPFRRRDLRPREGAGFIYAPKQELFVAPMWTPEREDLLIELCGEIDDEDTSLVERAEERADRFVDYKDKRISDAERAQEAVSRIADNIPLGQPILIGHHSERHARKDAERIENGMRKSVQMWQTAKYWEDRARGALRHAKYKELPGVRHRRIKGLEADLRRYQNSFTPDPKTRPQIWDGEEHVWITNGSRGGRWAKSSGLPAIEQQSRRWIEHLQNRIAYEKAKKPCLERPVVQAFAPSSSRWTHNKVPPASG
jgi:hypothetical protein